MSALGELWPDSAPYDAITEAVRLARAGTSLSPFVLAGRDKRPAFRSSWLQNATSDITAVVQDFEHAVSKFGNDAVLVGWALGKDGFCAMDDDHGLPPVVIAVLDHPHAENRTHRGRHLVFRNPDGLVPGNSTARFPDASFGEFRGQGGLVVVAGIDRPGFDPAQLAHAGPFPFPEWLTPANESAPAADDRTVAKFLADHGRRVDGSDRLDHIDHRLHNDPAPKSRHDRLINFAGRLMRDARAGVVTAVEARAALWVWWESTGVADDYPRTWRGDFTRYIACAIGYANAEPQDVIDERRAKAERWAAPQEPGGNTSAPPGDVACVSTCALEETHATFRRWLGEDYDLEALDAVLATAAAERLAGDPLWLLVISGSGNAKTETVQALASVGALVVSTISSEGAFLSGTPAKQKAKDATGGLLRQLGESGLLVIKDVTSILSMNRDTRATVLAAIREIHDGNWVRYLGTDGGRTLAWRGRIGIIGATTTAWDRAHDVIASMGDRFLVVRMDSAGPGRLGAGRQSRRNVGHEHKMRDELAAVVAGVLAGADLGSADDVDDDEAEALLAAADLVTLARTGVDYDYRGDVIDAHAPEMPTRFMKQLVQLVRGSVAIGMNRTDALRLAIRCARDSMPPLRLAILDDVAEHPASTATEVRRRLDNPRATVDRQLQSLHILGVLCCDESERDGGKGITWRYTLEPGTDPSALRPSPDLSPHTLEHSKRERDNTLDESMLGVCTDISGDGPTRGFGTQDCPACAMFGPFEVCPHGDEPPLTTTAPDREGQTR